MTMASKANKKQVGVQNQEPGPGLPERMAERFLPFHSMQWERFEHLCVELAEVEPGIHPS